MSHSTNPNARDKTTPSEIASLRPIGLTRIHSNDRVDEEDSNASHESACDRIQRALNDGRPTR